LTGLRGSGCRVAETCYTERQMECLDVIASNAEAPAEHGILGEAWTFPPPRSRDRAPLAALY